MPGRRKSTDSTPERKLLRWRFGRKRSTSQIERNSSATSPQVSPPAQSGEPLPESPVTTTSTSDDRRQHDAHEASLREMVRSLSMTDDPSKFGAGTLAARRLQREELDRAMARNLFQRELFRAPRANPQSPPSQNSQTPENNNPSQAQGQVHRPVNIDLGALQHMRPAFTETQWAAFTADPLRYIQSHGLPEQVEVAEVREGTVPTLIATPAATTAATSAATPAATPGATPAVTPSSRLSQATQPLSEHFILPPDFPVPDPVLAGTAIASASTASPTTPPKGLTPDEIPRLLTTFGHKETVRVTDLKRQSRIRGRQLPRGAKTRGILSEEDDANECSICLLEFEAGQKVGLLPCCHRFHCECVLEWLQREASCPECREELRNHLH